MRPSKPNVRVSLSFVESMIVSMVSIRVMHSVSVAVSGRSWAGIQILVNNIFVAVSRIFSSPSLGETAG